MTCQPPAHGVRAIVLDLGGVVLGINFRQVFSHWAAAAGVEERIFYDHWRLDDAYRQHKIGAIDFHRYTQHMTEQLGVELSQEAWRVGWNALWTEPHHRVVGLFPAIKRRYGLFAFSNTNATHAVSFRHRYADALAGFDQLFLSHEIGARKPDPQSFLDVCERIQVAPHQVLFLDDSQENVSGARSVGLIAQHTRSEQEVVQALRDTLDTIQES